MIGLANEDKPGSLVGSRVASNYIKRHSPFQRSDKSIELEEKIEQSLF